MHKLLFEHMAEITRSLPIPECPRVIDIGSYDVNGSLRSLFSRGSYIGVDRVAGPNVDVVMPSDYQIPVRGADLVVSSSCLQYVRNPFKLVAEGFRCLKNGGFAVWCAPRHEGDGLLGLPDELSPNGDSSFDCWRFLVDGMAELLLSSGFEILDVHYYNQYCWGVGKREQSALN